MGFAEKRKASFCDLPLEILEMIAMNLHLPDYLHFRALCGTTWSLFGCSALIPILKDIQTLENDTSNVRCEDCHYISRGHILSQAYRKNGLVPKMDALVQLKASLKHPSGDMVERAARSRNYKMLLTLMIGHGVSFREVQGGINRLCCEAFEQGNFEKFRWLFPKGASLDVLAGVVFDFSGCHTPRSPQACRSHLLALGRALRKGATPSGSDEAMIAALKLHRRNGLNDGWRRPIT